VADRIIRDELWNSERWLDLPSDTHRLIYVSLLSIADDFGNLEGGPRRLYRWMHCFSQVKTEEDSIKLMSALQDVDLVRRYEVKDDLSTGSKEYWHLPRFKNSRRYWARKCPPSPYPEQTHKESKDEEDQCPDENPSADLPQPSSKTSGGVGVGVGVGEEGLSISPTRGQEVKVKNVLKKMPQGQDPGQEQTRRKRDYAADDHGRHCMCEICYAKRMARTK
jgi:hypothetical protein